MSTVTSTSQPATSSPLRRLMSDHPLVAYFVIAFGVVAVLLVVFTRGRLGYKPEQNAQLIEAPRPAEMPATGAGEQTGRS